MQSPGTLMRMTGTQLGRGSRLIPPLAGVGGGVLTLYLLLPVSGVDTLPPVCYSALGYSVPCGAGWAFGAALAIGLLTAWAVSLVVRRRSPT